MKNLDHKIKSEKRVYESPSIVELDTTDTASGPTLSPPELPTFFADDPANITS